jgi:hypothetical protein
MAKLDKDQFVFTEHARRITSLASEYDIAMAMRKAFEKRIPEVKEKLKKALTNMLYELEMDE